MTDAAEVLECVARTYSECTSYRDMGEVVSVTITGERQWQRATSRRPFQTAFVRPDRFLFEFKEMTVGPSSEWAHFAVWRNASGVHSWHTLDAGRRDGFASVADALAAATGISGGSAHDVPRLLGLVGGAWPLPGADEVDLLGPEEVDGRRAWRLHGRRFGRPTALWIDVERFLVLRRFERALHTPELARAQRQSDLARADLPDEVRRELERAPLVDFEFTLETTVLQRPAVDEPIDAGVFDVRPPE